MMEKFPVLSTALATAGVLALGACGVSPEQTQSAYVHCDGVTWTDLGDGRYSVDPLVSVRPGGEQPTAVRQGSNIRTKVPYGNSLIVETHLGTPLKVDVVIVTGDVHRLAFCPAIIVESTKRNI